jgi:hypothetical protein
VTLAPSGTVGSVFVGTSVVTADLNFMTYLSNTYGSAYYPTFTNTAIYTGTNPYGVSGSASASSTVTVLITSSLEITKTAAPPVVTPLDLGEPGNLYL